MYKSFISLIILCLFLSSCIKEQDPFELSKQHIGLLTDSTQVKDLKTIFVNDSVVNFNSNDEFSGSINNIDIFDKEGKKLLVLTPQKTSDSTSVIESIQIIDSRFKTNKNISTLSNFEDISSNYNISRIDNLINSIVITINEINASFVIDKKELPANLRFNTDVKIEATHIPDDAKLKYFFINWSN